MERREFLRRLGLSLGAGWALSRLAWPLPVLAGSPRPRLALLADAHLKDGNPYRPEAQALARAVAEIRALKPAPDLVLFAGDLAHNGNPKALALGQEILADLPSPPLMVMGEGDGLPEATAPWRRLFGETWFSQSFTGFHLMGLHTVWCPGPGGPFFYLGEAQRRRLAGELARLNPATPLVILSHAPLTDIFRPWQQWTKDGETVFPLLNRFQKVLCLHGHVHGAVAGGQWSVVSEVVDCSGGNPALAAANRKPQTANPPLHQGLPATAWPLPQPLLGTPATLRPGLGPGGCGWGMVALTNRDFQFLPHVWQA